MRLHRIQAALFALFVPGVVWARPAPAAPTGVAPRSPEARKAQAYVDLATTFFQEKNYAEALAELRKAELLLGGDPSLTTVRFNIARCLEEMKRPVEALAAYEIYLGGGVQGPTRARAEAAVAKLKAEHFGRLELTCLPVGATVTLDGGSGAVKVDRPCPVAEALPAGDYAATVRAPGHLERSMPFQIRAGGVKVERVELQEVAPVAAVPSASAARPAPAAAPAAAVEVPAQPAPAGAERGPWPFVALGTGGLALIGGGVMHAMMGAARDDAADTSPGSAARVEKTDTFESLRTGTLVSYGLGAAVTGVGVWLLLRAPATGTSAGVVAAPGGVEVRF